MMSVNLYRSTFVYPCILAGALGVLLLECSKSESKPSKPTHGQSPKTPSSVLTKKEPAVTKHAADTDAEYAELDVSGVKMRITRDDGASIKASLLKWLQQNDLGGKERLIHLTKPALVYIDFEGYLCIGQWTLRSNKGELELYIRFPMTRTGGLAYSARITKEKGVWRVLAVSKNHILPLRSPPGRR